MRPIRRIIVHWSASARTTTVADIRRWHVEGNGWSDIGYHRIILHPDTVPGATEWGQLVKLGRPDRENGAHTVGRNTGSLGVCVVAGPGYPLHPLQIKALEETCKALAIRYRIPAGQVFGHRDFNPTQCPGGPLYALIQKIRRPQ